MRRSYKVVPAEPEHLRHLPGIERAAAALFPTADLPEPLRSDSTGMSQLRQAQAAGRLWVALSPSLHPVGFALVRIVDGAAHLQEVDVHPRHGRRGVGAALVRQVCGWARAEGYLAVTLTTFRHLRWNAPFYARLGFRALGNDELTPGLAALLRREVARGLDAGKRVAMRHDLGSGRSGVPGDR